jgi:pyruvate formate lyase activating enzyme
MSNAHVQYDIHKCVYCDNCIKTCKHSASPRVRKLSAQDVFAELQDALPFIRGITVSGGECTLYPEFLYELAALSRQHKKTFFLDSNGTYNIFDNPALCKVCDSVMLDIKADPDDHADSKKVLGAEPVDLYSYAVQLASANKLYELRTVVCAGLLDNEKLVTKVCNHLAPYKNNFRYKLIKYRPNGVRVASSASLQTPTNEYMSMLAGIVRSFGIEVVVT